MCKRKKTQKMILINKHISRLDVLSEDRTEKNTSRRWNSSVRGPIDASSVVGIPWSKIKLSAGEFTQPWDLISFPQDVAVLYVRPGN
jgi:hypothetical protein